MINGKTIKANYDLYLLNLLNHPLSDHPVSWYERQMIGEVRPQSKEYGLTDWQGAGIFAVLSPQLSWDRNVKLAKGVLEFISMTGRAPTTITSYQRMKVESFWNGSIPKMGPKEHPFFLSFLGELDLPCIDRVIMAALMGKAPHEGSGTLFPSTAYAWRLLRQLFRDASLKLGLPPAEIQWRIWEARQKARVKYAGIKARLAPV